MRCKNMETAGIAQATRKDVLSCTALFFNDLRNGVPSAFTGVCKSLTKPYCTPNER